MTPDQQVSAAFAAYLRNDFTRRAFLISGPWGCGKTYLFGTTLAPIAHKQPKPFKTLYISVAGLKDADQVDRTIFMAAYPLTKTRLARVSGSIARGLLRFAEIDIEDLIKVEASIDAQTLVCIDDLERLDPMAIPAVFGKLADMLEQKGAKVVLLTDESKLAGLPEYLQGKEKIIGKSIAYTPDYAKVAQIGTDLAKDSLLKLLPTAWEAPFGEIHKSLLEAIRLADCRNIRLCTWALQNGVDLLDCIPQEQRAHFLPLVGRIFFTATALTVELGREPGQLEAIAALFAAPEAEMFNIYSSASSSNFVQGSTDGRVRFLEDRLGSEAYPPLFCTQLFDQVARGTCSPELLVNELDAVLTPSQFEAPLKALEHYWRLSQQEFDRALGSIFEQLSRGEYKSLNELNRVGFVLFRLCYMKSISQEAHEIFELLMDAASRIQRNAFEAPTPTEVLDESWMPPSAGDQHARFIDNLKRISQQIAKQNWAKQKGTLFTLIQANPGRFARELNESPYARAAIFDAEGDVKRVAKLITEVFHDPSRATEDLFLLARAFRSRYRPEDMDHVLVSEKPWLTRLSEEIRDRCKDIGPTRSLAHSALQELQVALRAAIA